MLLLERIRLLAARQVFVLDLVALAVEQIERLQPVGAGMAGHDHPVERGLFGRRHAGLLLWDFSWAGRSADYHGLKDFDDISSLTGGGAWGCRHLAPGAVVRLQRRQSSVCQSNPAAGRRARGGTLGPSGSPWHG